MKKIISLCIIISLSINVYAQFQEDKVKHFIVGNLITTGSTLLAYDLTDNKKQALLIGFGVGVLAGASKEIYDSTGRGCCDFKDFAWTCIGSAVSTIRFTIKL